MCDLFLGEQKRRECFRARNQEFAIYFLFEKDKKQKKFMGFFFETKSFVFIAAFIFLSNVLLESLEQSPFKGDEREISFKLAKSNAN